MSNRQGGTDLVTKVTPTCARCNKSAFDSRIQSVLGEMGIRKAHVARSRRAQPTQEIEAFLETELPTFPAIV